MPFDIPNRFTPAEAEPELFRRWESSGAFQPKRGKTGPDGSATDRFVVMIPPPNVTGALHMGHALNNTVQDVMVRFHRKSGRETLWVPGTDHAGIATQAVIEKKLFKEQGITREQLGREKFLAEVWAWKEQYGNRILEQLKRMGCSCDFTRTRFTMDEDLSTAVRVAFTRLWEKGLIYRGPRLVNWDCKLQTAVGDDEILHETRKSKLWYIKYPVEGKPGEFVTVATTRPETLLGDTGVAVNPDDPRWKALIGKNVVLPLLDRPIPVIGDETVEKDFGTGAVKVTPGHDPNDYARGQRFKLPIVSIFTDAGQVNEAGGPYAGVSREEARKRVVADLEARGLLEKIADHEHSVAISDRSGTVIEPRISEQWFVKMEPLAKPAIAAVKGTALRFVPERWTKVYLDWLENVRDWCISRQLWWGHRVPVWYDGDGVGVASATELKIGDKHPKTGKPITRQDPDVLDTWASSWLWPLATLGWPKPTDDLKRYYPTQFLSTAREIIYLWVARMVMAGYEFGDGFAGDARCPFTVCYLNATVLDGQGRRMSKSAGNGIDPVEMIDKFGADAMRISLMLLTVEGQDIRFSEQRVEEARNFVNKFWNATRFVLQKVPAEAYADVDLAKATRLEDRWILARLRETVATVSDALPNCRFHEASQALRRFLWNDFCDWYLEIAKVRLEPTESAASRRMASKIAVTVIERALHLLHPMTPFVTEALWGHLKSAGFLSKEAPDVIVASWPTTAGLPEKFAAGAAGAVDAVVAMDALQALTSALRNLRSKNGVEERAAVKAHVRLPDEKLVAVLDEAKPWFERLARATLAGFSTKEARPAEADADVVPMAPFGSAELYLPLGGLIDKDARRKDLATKLEKLMAQIASLEKKLGNDGFVQGAPAEVVMSERERLARLKDESTKLRQARDDLGG
ncbi:MAG TPA: valine--tRNA ligase [Planctomycetota bacterium]|jgi:valyl-tRNA synthetase|nr:valine--tRNA ligase [Planctomycetota bacterium]